MKVIFLDRDGTLIWEPPGTQQVDSLEKLRILPGMCSNLRGLLKRGFKLVMVTNQDGLGTASFPYCDFIEPQKELMRRLKSQGVSFKAVFVSPDMPGSRSATRKPATGLVNKFIRQNQIDLENSWVIGDRESDRRFAKNLGAKFLKVQTNKKFNAENI